MRRGLLRETERRICGGEDLEDIESGESDETQEGGYGRWAGSETRGHGLT